MGELAAAGCGWGRRVHLRAAPRHVASAHHLQRASNWQLLPVLTSLRWPAPLPAVLPQQMQLFLHLLPWLRSVLRAAPHPAPHAARLPADGVSIDGRRIKVDWATRKDFDFFGWKWTENAPSRSPSRSPSRCVDRGHPLWSALQLAPAQQALLCRFAAGVGGASARAGALPNALACASHAALPDAAALMKHSCCAMQGLQGALPLPAAIPLPGRPGRLLLKRAR